MLNILVVGGAGYIGSHMVKYLSQNDCKVVTVDNLSSGYRDAIVFGEFIEGDISEVEFLRQIFEKHQFDVVMHFASFIQVGESVREPTKYYQNNVVNTLNLLSVMKEFNVDKFVFSSSAAIFGEPETRLITENHPKNPLNPYGKSKLMVEQILEDFAKGYQLNSVSLRYFNAAGADPEGELGERHLPETHLIPLVLQVASKRRDSISVYGNDYDTPDGTCIRDYVHVSDLCSAHWLAVKTLVNGASGHQAFNLGSGKGFSVREVIDVAQKVTGRPIPNVVESRRSGDPACLVADSTYAKSVLGWKPQFGKLEEIIKDAWNWEVKNFILNNH
ncbi:UDP-glucose 4-epimerase GalE [Undibacterium jejuense]|uniref:UDP-glucose 4-epimerase n=1 Tax=Undibacterium jejuense TaxID=1344949 RepID=A0A923KRM5_9BURK|nr:UDP-glucose 4-epimerase GalE [Undibacterium jejuense]MBC3864191.1 UDP-glucose 4-epimerase GalE [Undibacterium jejuense]